jgi:PhzF family phenazine biosynthesis protein
LVLDARGLDATQMQAIAADVGYSETAFLMARPDETNVYDVRYFSPKREVPFCGHATIAAAVALAERSPAAELIFHTPAGFVSITTSQNDRGETVAELTSIAPRVSDPDPDLVQAVLGALHWSSEYLDPAYPVRLANAGSEHLVLVTKTRERLADLAYGFDPRATTGWSLCSWYGRSPRSVITPGTHLPAVEWSRIPPQAPVRQHSAAICESSA